VFSLDAVGKPAEYIRFGTIWKEVIENYRRCLDFKENVKVRVNVTTSVYNYHYLSDLMDLLIQQWPEVVSFGVPNELYLNESVIPLATRELVIAEVDRAIKIIARSGNKIKKDQWYNTLNALRSINQNLKQKPWDSIQYNFLKTYIEKLDLVKNIKISDYCPETVKILNLP
jgi:sulfatase maturation enzyme AslB (radical SAM superfamily)